MIERNMERSRVNIADGAISAKMNEKSRVDSHGAYYGICYALSRSLASTV